MNEITIFSVAEWFLNKEPMTHKKLQKLCWYAYSWFIYIENDSPEDLTNKLFDCKFQAWVHGPVSTELYDIYKGSGMTLLETSKSPKFNAEVEKFLNDIFDNYGEFDGGELESITHQELPWKNARGDLKPYEASQNVISDKDIFKEYAER
ncbi:Panacea domain-containing protein [Culicoidibacter larvae]|uniref:DUF4065 domain-containing protein n=1 Tax=Culicoidibacter larvae TaxID=2579976 RepID=A0A5R8Q8K5_9FIRM|nr:type II toxin-antitoxin system antitoxin SocA domain-containing protein [Culicoidibacter larvae]TLG72038.1 DUF4065 domain-containing protein [Culicoidibacter larvae]